MSSSVKLSILALASSAVAARHGHVYGHHRLHASGTGGAAATGSAGLYPYPNANGTRVWGSTGMSVPTAYGSSSAVDAEHSTLHSTAYHTAYHTVTMKADNAAAVPSSAAAPAGYGSSSSLAAAQSGDSCAAVTVTYTEKVTATITEGQSIPSSTDSSPVDSTPVASAPGYSAPAYGSSSSIDASPVGSTPAASAPGYSAPMYNSSSSTGASPVGSTPVASAPGYSAPAYGSSSSTDASPVGSTPAVSAPGYSAPAYSSSAGTEASPAGSSVSAPAYSAPASTSSSSTAAPIPSSSSEDSPVTTAAASYSSASTSDAITATPYGGANKQGGVHLSLALGYPSASSTASAAASSSTSSGSSSGKRGLAYNDASLTSCFKGSREITWAQNWGSSSNGLSSDYTFIPTLWGTRSDFVDSWNENAKAAISSGSTHLFSFNEPDLPAQANLGYAAAATAYAQYMNPFKGQAQLCAPAVTNGGGDSMGLSYLKNFLSACTDCQIDCLNIHWYDSAENVDYFKSHVEQAIELANGKPVYISEFGCTGSDDQINSFLQEVMPWMDNNSNIAGYAYFMVESGNLLSGTEPSTYGRTYMSYN
ncbi:glycoside hydrolase family 128 protein [Sphaerulina musiva SO2202]|uniref:Glycoside hydrolase family 128 protein n=1 Tax=Sphaerulina musiva (strain SO2202) TaxID=692275 RepID=M3D3E4_SPHMS|nr:glycoside hydrolase family 128 protein [Sphaerulina musiva SO2202]EMF12750.1 glycoside hydrolase family 128 protein [Sphaerulina musiva SO2202]